MVIYRFYPKAITKMNKEEIHNMPMDENSESVGKGYYKVPMSKRASGPRLFVPRDEGSGKDDPQGELTVNWLILFIGVAACTWYFLSGSDWQFILCLAVIVLIHEMGHVIVGKSFGCYITEMQVFYLTFLSYKPKLVLGGSSWRNIKWSLGILPFGGVTMFKSRPSDDNQNGSMYRTAAASPFINDKPAWQRLLISAAGVLFNFATFLIIYLALPYVPDAGFGFFHMIASLSLILAVLNILPVYPLDGGSIVFAVYEMITGKKPSPQFVKVCGMIGAVFIVLFFWVFPEWLNGIINSVFRAFF